MNQAGRPGSSNPCCLHARWLTPKWRRQAASASFPIYYKVNDLILSTMQAASL